MVKGEIMKKILIFIYVMFIPNVVLSATMCAKNNTLVVALDPGVGGSGYSYSALDSTWVTTFSYGSVKGVSACTSYAGSMGQVISTTTGKTINATRGEESGRYCWCKVVHPVSSLWAFYYAYGSASGCASFCAYYCGSYVRAYESLRAGLFGSVASN